MTQGRDPRLEALKQELKPLMKRANQRLLRLEQADLTSSHGYQAAQKVTGAERPRFNVRDKTLEQLQDDKQRMLNFLDYKSSTITGTKHLLRDYAQKMRVPFQNDPERLAQESGKFFRLSKYVQEFIRNTTQERAISSDEIFLGISRAVDAGEVSLDDIDFEDFDLAQEQMERIVREAGGQTRTNSLFDELENMDNVEYRGSMRIRGFDPNDF